MLTDEELATYYRKTHTKRFKRVQHFTLFCAALIVILNTFVFSPEYPLVGIGFTLVLCALAWYIESVINFIQNMSTEDLLKVHKKNK